MSYCFRSFQMNMGHVQLHGRKCIAHPSLFVDKVQNMITCVLDVRICRQVNLLTCHRGENSLVLVDAALPFLPKRTDTT